MKRVMSLTVLAGLLMFALPGVVFAASQDKLVIGVRDLGAERLDYSRPSGSTNYEIARILSRNLIEFGPSGEYVPGLAEAWKMSPDGTTWDLVLRKGVKWQNGDTLTAQDLVFGVERMRRPEINAGIPVMDLLNHLVKVEVVDEYHVRYHFNGPFPMFPYYVNMAPPVPKAYIEKVGDDVFSNERPIGAGPFRFVRRVKGSEYEFEAFDGYFGKVPPFKTLIVKIMPENATRLAALKTGEIDIAKDVQGEMLDAIKNTPGLTITSVPGGSFSYIVFPGRYEKNSPWTDLRVRKAVALAIDREAIAKAVYRGQAVPAVFPDAGFAFGMPKDVRPYPYDTEKAKALLAEAGYPNGLPGVWDMQTMNSGSVPFQPETTQAVAGYLSKIGIKTRYQLMEGGAFAAAYTSKKLTGLPVTGSAETRFDVGLKTNTWEAKAVSWSWQKDEDTNKLWEEQLTTVNPEKRRKILEEAVHTMVDDVRAVPFVEPKTIFALGPKVKQYELRKGDIWVTDDLAHLGLK